MATEYGDKSIKTLSGIEHYRFRSSMYGFQVSNINGPLMMIKEIVDNSTDEALDKNKIYPIDITFFVSKDKSTFQCLVRDHGRGIPVGKFIDCLATANTSGKYEAGSYGGASTGTNGVGSKVVAALSKNFVAFTKRNDGFGYLKIEKGKLKDQSISRRPIDKNQDTIGTTVIFQPDEEIVLATKEMFGKTSNGDKNGFELFCEKTELCSIFRNNVQINVRTVDGLVKPSDFAQEPVKLWHFLTELDHFNPTVVFQSDLKITPRQYVMNKFKLGQPVWELEPLIKETPNVEEDPLSFYIDLFVDEKSSKGQYGYIGAVNGTPIVHPDSSHLSALQSVLKDYLHEFIDDSNKLTYFDSKYRLPISGCISVGWLGAEFIGNDKSRFENRNFEVLYRKHLRSAFKKLTESSDGGIWDKLWENIHEQFEIEYAKYSKTAYKAGGSLKNICYDLRRPESFNNCKSQDSSVTELYITEGDSAAGRVKTVRNELTQAIYKLRGKPINPFRCDREKLNKNEIYADLVRILGVTPADKNLDNMRFKRIYIVTDADPDGKHIVCLVVAIIYAINPKILEEGRVAVMNPPLFAVANGEQVAYLRDMAALNDAYISSYKTLFEIDAKVGSQLFHVNKDMSQFREICMIVESVGSVVARQADLLNINAYILEQLLHVVDYLGESNVNTEKIKKILGLDQVVWDKVNNTVVLVEDIIEMRIPLAKLQSTLRKEILPLYERFHWRKLELFVTTKYSTRYAGEPCSFVMLYEIFQTCKKILKICRFKGLGEMDEQAMKDTCVGPNRCFVTIKSIGDAEKLYSMLDDGPEARKKLIKVGYIEEV